MAYTAGGRWSKEGGKKLPMVCDCWSNRKPVVLLGLPVAFKLLANFRLMGLPVFRFMPTFGSAPVGTEPQNVWLLDKNLTQRSFKYRVGRMVCSRQLIRAIFLEAVKGSVSQPRGLQQQALSICRSAWITKNLRASFIDEQ